MSRTNLTATPGSHAVIASLVVKAPREDVFKAYTDPALIPAWRSPEGVKTRVDIMKVKPGGQWRFVQTSSEGEFGFSGVYHRVSAPQQIVDTFEFEGTPGHVSMETVTFEAQSDGTTRLMIVTVFQSVADRDEFLQSGMEGGAQEMMDRFAKLVEGRAGHSIPELKRLQKAPPKNSKGRNERD